MNLLIVYILVSDCHTILVMMLIDESVCSRVLGDELFGYCYISCLNVTCVQMSLYINSDILSLPTCYKAYWSTMNVYIPVSDCHTMQYTVHEYQS